MMPQAALTWLVSAALVVSAQGWADIAGALTYKGTHHVFQGCPGGNQPGSSARGWHHAASKPRARAMRAIANRRWRASLPVARGADRQA